VTPSADADPDTILAACLFAVDPAGTGGAVLRSGPGPERDHWMDALRQLLPAAPVRRLPCHATDARILGGLDLPATLRAGRPIAQRGLLAEADGGILVVVMAERQNASAMARVTAALDAGAVMVERDGIAFDDPARFGVVALDEGRDDDERPHAGLLDRLAFHLVPSQGAILAPMPHDAQAIADARTRLGDVTAGEEVVAALCGTAMALGIASPRAVLLALAAARGHAALSGRTLITSGDAAVAARLVLAPRATRIPAEPEDAAEEPESAEPPPGDSEPPDAGDTGEGHAAADQVLAAAAAAIPPGLLDRLRQGAPVRRAAPGRSGGPLRSGSRGRPAGTRAGALRAGERLNVIETLRTAAPWQAVRRRERAPEQAAHHFLVRPDDFRVARTKPRTRTTTIFVVDASGSAAMHRLAEAKGAIELLLAECYVRRDRVALVAFRNRGAEVLLPPTRSLARARRNLAGLPGGGGTPLAAGIETAAGIALAVRRAGETPAIVLLGDGRPNIRRDGSPGRPEAEADAMAAARNVAALGIAALCIDTAPRPQPFGRELAWAMAAQYVALPQADATALSSAAARVTGNRPGRPTLLAS